jgi:hypothetical protein
MPNNKEVEHDVATLRRFADELESFDRRVNSYPPMSEDDRRKIADTFGIFARASIRVLANYI